METRNEFKVEPTSETIIHIQATTLGDVKEVSFTLPLFKEVTDAIERIAESVITTLQKVKTKKDSIEFGLEVAHKLGQLTALQMKGSGSSNLRHWELLENQSWLIIHVIQIAFHT